MVTANEYLTSTGTVLRSIPGGRRPGDEWDEPVPYLPADVAAGDPPALAARVDELEVQVTQAQDNAEVWQETARQFARRADRMLTDLARLTGATRAATRAKYLDLPESGGSQP